MPAEGAQRVDHRLRCDDPATVAVLREDLHQRVVQVVQLNIQRAYPNAQVLNQGVEQHAHVPARVRDVGVAVTLLQLGVTSVITTQFSMTDRGRDVFTEELIDTYIGYKRDKEVAAVRLRPHPYEFALYYDI